MPITVRDSRSGLDPTPEAVQVWNEAAALFREACTLDGENEDASINAFRVKPIGPEESG